MIRFIVLAATLAATSAQAYSGNDLYQGIVELRKMDARQPADMYQAGVASGYIQHAFDDRSAGGEVCAPRNATQKEIENAVFENLEKDKAGRIYPAMVLVAVALGKAYPCKK